MIILFYYLLSVSLLLKKPESLNQNSSLFLKSPKNLKARKGQACGNTNTNSNMDEMTSSGNVDSQAADFMQLLGGAAAKLCVQWQ